MFAAYRLLATPEKALTITYQLDSHVRVMRLLRRPLYLVMVLIMPLSPDCAYAITMDLRRNTSQLFPVSVDLYCHSLVESLSGAYHFASDCMSEHHLKLQ